MKAERIDQLMLAVLLGAWGIALIEGWFTGELQVAFFWGGAFAVLSVIAFQFRTSGFFAFWVAHAIEVMVALQIQVMHGMIAIHFGVFVALALLMAYRNPWVILVGLITVGVHHISFNYLQSLNIGIWLFAGGPSWVMVLVHAAYAGFEAVVLMYFAMNMRQEQRVSTALIGATHRMLATPNRIDLTVSIDDVDHPVVKDFRTLVQRLAQALGQTVSYGNVIAESLPKLRSTSAQTLEQANSLRLESEQVASATEEMSVAVREVAANTHAVAELTEQAWQENQQSRESVERTTEAIDKLVNKLKKTESDVLELSRYCSEISSASNVINEIADQTNLLALNAAIEAARAGEQGRGFAVVADEVRQLAQRTQSSTEDIANVIRKLIATSEVSATAVEESVALVNETAELGAISRQATETISKALGEVRSQVQQIATAMEEQTSVSNEISNKITSIDTLNGTMHDQIDENQRQLDGSSEQMHSILEGLRIFQTQSAQVAG